MSTAVMDAPVPTEEAGWVYLTDVDPSFTAGLRPRLVSKGPANDRLYVVPAGRLKRTGRESVELPDLDDLI